MNTDLRPFSMRKQIATRVGQVVDRLLTLYRLVPPDYTDTVFYVWPRRDRMVVIFDPLALRKPEAVVSPKFVHHVSTALQGRRVVPTNHRGVFLQIAYMPPSLPKPAVAPRELDLTRQPGPLHVPIGVTKNGRALWLPLDQMDGVLIGGTRRMGKTNLLHTWIQALLHGGWAQLYLWDGKGGVEFGRYADRATVADDDGLGTMLAALNAEMERRRALLRQAGHTSIAAYNRQTRDRLPALVPIVDELAQVPDALQDTLARLVAVGGAFGVYPVLATQRPDAQAVQGLLRSNLGTRIALPVPTRFESQIILGRAGAEKLPKQPGHLLLVWNARLIQARAFLATLPPAIPQDTPRVRSPLTPEEERLARLALDAFEGRFRIRELAERSGISRRFVERLAKRWQAMGYLTPPERDEDGRPLGRRVTQALERLLQQPATEAAR